jgi:hypothetical protein
LHFHVDGLRLRGNAEANRRRASSQPARCHGACRPKTPAEGGRGGGDGRAALRHHAAGLRRRAGRDRRPEARHNRHKELGLAIDRDRIDLAVGAAPRPTPCAPTTAPRPSRAPPGAAASRPGRAKLTCPAGNKQQHIKQKKLVEKTDAATGAMADHGRDAERGGGGREEGGGRPGRPRRAATAPPNYTGETVFGNPGARGWTDTSKEALEQRKAERDAAAAQTMDLRTTDGLEALKKSVLERLKEHHKAGTRLDFAEAVKFYDPLVKGGSGASAKSILLRNWLKDLKREWFAGGGDNSVAALFTRDAIRGCANCRGCVKAVEKEREENASTPAPSRPRRLSRDFRRNNNENRRAS